MKKIHHLPAPLAAVLLCLAAFFLPFHTTSASEHDVLAQFIDRIGGTGASAKFVTEVTPSLSSNGKDAFVLTSSEGKPCIKGSSVLAVTTGLNWYLNHVAHVNLSWSNLTTDLTAISLPLPQGEERHECTADYRYYLNYCTFSYSMSTWTWERWQKEIDWMALHGINMPLQIVGLDVVWRNLLTQDLGYTNDEANKFIAGPCFQAWWGMNNLQGWGGPNPEWWYKRQEELCQKILARQRELGMSPVLPGYSGMVPSDISSKGYTAINQGNWCAFVRPYILDPNSTAFPDIAAKYYHRLEEVMGTSDYYSMDPFHEGANTSGINVPAAYKKIAQAMQTAQPDAKWVIQFWQWSSAQYNVLDQVDKGSLVVLDLYSDAHSHFGEYKGHDAIYCILPNFGARTGLFGRFTKVMEDFYAQQKEHGNLKGVGATPEGIEQVPVLYDALFELPWRSTAPDPAQWMADYAVSRYGTKCENAQKAWEQLRLSALNCPTALQGPQEAVVCARPALSVSSVSSWGGTEIFYDPQQVAEAAFLLAEARSQLSGPNYKYDLADVTRQALTDYAYFLLQSINAAYTSGDKEAYTQRRDAYLQLMLDLDELLCSTPGSMLGHWTQMARAIADEADGTTEADRQWLELQNARTLITTWGERAQSENGGLRDYSYREWGGMLKDFYYPRWKTFFENLDAGTAQPDWYNVDHAWAGNAAKSYSDEPQGDTGDIATSLLDKYFLNIALPEGGGTYHLYRHFDTDAHESLVFSAYRGTDFTLPLQNERPVGTTLSFCIDLNHDGAFSSDETSSTITLPVPANDAIGRTQAQLTLSDGTKLSFSIILKDVISAPRTVSVKSADSAQGTATIQGTTESQLNSAEEVTILATPATGYDFFHWTNSQGETVSTDNPYTYYGAAAETFTAHFLVNKWGSPAEDLSELSTIASYGQYLTSISGTLNGQYATSLYSADAAPDRLFHTTQVLSAPQGSRIVLNWKDTDAANGMAYCRLSAYIDLNADGDFDDANELICVVGTKNSNDNTQLSDYTLPILLPYNIPLGLTHIRLRFDSSWTTGWDGTTDAMPADASTKRMVYDVPVHVTSYSATACTVSARSHDTSCGTVDANGQPDSYTYAPGEEVVLRAYPATDYHLKEWKDQYDRTVPEEWTDGNFLRFHAPESGVYTAYFEKDLPAQLTFGNWTFDYTTSQGNITLTKAVSGEGALEIPAAYEGLALTALANGALQGQKGLTELTIPASMTSLGGNTLYYGTLQGNGVTNAPACQLTTPLSASQSWNLQLAVSADGSTFNEYGSALLATGEEALGNTYDAGFQLYMKPDRSVLLKTGSEEVKTFQVTEGCENFTIGIDHSATGNMTFTIASEKGTDTYSLTGYALSPISTFSTALPKGVSLTQIALTDPTIDSAPFRGCSSLAKLQVKSGNAAFRALDNVLYTADRKRLIAYPEGRISHKLNLSANVRSIASHAFTEASELRRIICSSATPPLVDPDAFETQTFRAQVSPAYAEAYRQAFPLPLCFAVEATDDMPDEQAARIVKGDAVILKANEERSGTASALAADVPLWLSRTCKAHTYYPVFFPTPIVSLTVEGLSVEAASPDQLQLYTYANGQFIKAAEPSAGAYLMAVPEEWSGRELLICFAGQSASSASPAAWTGNGTPKAVTNEDTWAYTYSSSGNVFTLNPDAGYTLYPFFALLTGHSGSAASIEGPDAAQSGIAPVPGTETQEEKWYDLNGRKATSHSHGVVISDKGTKAIRRR